MRGKLRTFPLERINPPDDLPGMLRTLADLIENRSGVFGEMNADGIFLVVTGSNPETGALEHTLPFFKNVSNMEMLAVLHSATFMLEHEMWGGEGSR
ncbi:MAG: hypothetical protein D6812_02160 [Deltaproteobacteria bacterium]|nr:MAG: hypothetical protein D6812_02160 [Deltaproteobacteria bacterium]